MEELLGTIIVIVAIVGSISKNAKKSRSGQRPVTKTAPPHPYFHEADDDADEDEAPLSPPARQPKVATPAQSAQERAQMADDRRLWNNLEQQWAEQAKEKAVQAPAQAAPMAPTVHPHLEPDCVTHDAPGGSLNVTTAEGKDPCHEKQFSPRFRHEEEDEEEETISLDWSGEGMVKAFIMQEVLTRPCQRRVR